MIAGRDATLAEIGQLTVGKVSRRLLPLLFVLYVVCYLDRANVAFAKLPMNAVWASRIPYSGSAPDCSS